MPGLNYFFCETKNTFSYTESLAPESKEFLNSLTSNTHNLSSIQNFKMKILLLITGASYQSKKQKVSNFLKRATF